jgi:hypothetical protein
VPLGDELINLLKQARDQVLIVAPFIKVDAASKALEAIPDVVRDVRVVTRWKAQDVAAGVTDLDVLDRVMERPGASLLLHPCLHAKLYRADKLCLVGSANLTSKALGWACPPNLELLLSYDPSDRSIREFESSLLETTIPATIEIKSAVAAEAAKLPVAAPVAEEPFEYWLPSCSAPERLFNVYADYQLFRLSDSAAQAGRDDLRVLGIPSGLPESAFHQFVMAAFGQMPVVQRIKQRLVGPTNSALGAQMISEIVPPDRVPFGDPEMAWEILQRWLLTFGGGEFRLRSSGEELVRSKQL